MAARRGRSHRKNEVIREFGRRGTGGTVDMVMREDEEARRLKTWNHMEGAGCRVALLLLVQGKPQQRRAALGVHVGGHRFSDRGRVARAARHRRPPQIRSGSHRARRHTRHGVGRRWSLTRLRPARGGKAGVRLRVQRRQLHCEASDPSSSTPCRSCSLKTSRSRRTAPTSSPIR